MKHARIFVHFWLLLALVASSAVAAERTHTEAQRRAIAESGDPSEDADSNRRGDLIDLTKGGTLGPADPTALGTSGPIRLNMGPTGIIAHFNRVWDGDQIQVAEILPGSPAEGKLEWGDVILGANGKDFVVGENTGVALGNAIIEAERPENGGHLRLKVWRDRNYKNRFGKQDILSADIDKLMEETEQDSGLYEWATEEKKSAIVKKAAYDKYPMDASAETITLQLAVMGNYSDTSPWNCPVVEKIRENAYKVLEKKYAVDRRGRTRANTLTAIALVSSGKPEHRALVKKWVRSKAGHAWHPPTQRRGMGTWGVGFGALECAIYYDATGDEFVLPALRHYAIGTSIGQSAGGAWGHGFAGPTDFGEPHGRIGGYGALNAAGSRAYFLITLAHKLGVDHPEVVAAVERGRPFWIGAHVDKGSIGYGYHPPKWKDDSNGKNYGAAYASFVMGDKHAAKYYAMHSTHASFTRRGGHGSPNLWHYTPLSAGLCGPRATQMHMRNMRWFYTLARRHDGSFVVQGTQVGIGGKPVRDATATYLLHYQAPLKQLVITGKDADESIWLTDEDRKQILISARRQLNDKGLIEESGAPLLERDTDDLLALLNFFYPDRRAKIAAELGRRFLAGESTIPRRLIAPLNSSNARYRCGALQALTACGRASLRQSLGKITELLKNDPADFVRMAAVKALVAATDYNDLTRAKLLLEAAADEFDGLGADTANVRRAVRDLLFEGVIKKKGRRRYEEPPAIAIAPFDLGLDEELVRKGLVNIIMLDPGGTVPKTWTKETLLKLAGPIAHVASTRQMNDQMFAGRRLAGVALFRNHGYVEAVYGDTASLHMRGRLERSERLKRRFSTAYLTPAAVKATPGAYRMVLPHLRQMLHDDPLYRFVEKGRPSIITPLTEVIRLIEKDADSLPAPSVLRDVEKRFNSELANAGGTGARIRFCRAQLADPKRFNYFYKMAAMSRMAEILGPDAIDDLLPYLAHPLPQLRAHSRQLGAELVRSGAGTRLTELLAEARGETAGAILTILAEAGEKAALGPVRLALDDKDDVVRLAAIQALFTLGGDRVLSEVFDYMSRVKTPKALWGCERALLSRRDDARHAARVRSWAIRKLPGANPALRRSLLWVLGWLGGPDALAALKAEALKTPGFGTGRALEVAMETPEFEAAYEKLQEVLIALSYSPDRAADKVMLDIARRDAVLREGVASQCVRRMVGPGGVGDVTDDQRMDFAEPMLQMHHDVRLMTYLGKVHTGRAVSALFNVLKKTGDGTAVESIVASTNKMAKAPPKDVKLAVETLTQVMEFIEVTYLRGGLSRDSQELLGYTLWRQRQADAGRALNKLHKPEKAAIPDIDDMDLDI
jgi:HEAT repeat protein